MLFSSMIFLWVFLPAVLIINFLLTLVPFENQRTRVAWKNFFLLCASFFFYAWGGIYYLLIMVSSILLNYAGGFIIDKAAKSKLAKRLWLAVIIVLNLSILFFFKYFNMLIAIIESLMIPGAGFSEIWSTMISMEGTGALGLAQIVLPIGISFFTFQAMSYVMDVYLGKAKLQENVFDFALYVSLFPQLIAGPIVQYADVDQQIRDRRETLDLFASGIKRFCYGLGKKVLISNVVAEIADGVWSMETSSLGAFAAWVGLIAYTLQIYYDFSGYSDMAIGIGRMLGFEFKENFDYPYTSLSVSEFWRRWHISLGSWFREYIYIPLGGNRHGLLRTCFNIFVVYAVTGIWHGANFTFIAWGMFYAVLQILEKLFLGKLLQKNPYKIVNWIYTMAAVMLGWIYFRSNTIFQANEYLCQLFNFGVVNNKIFEYLSVTALVVICFGILFSGFVQRPLKGLWGKLHSRPALSYPVLAVDYLLQMVIIVLSFGKLVGGTYNAFIYFQF